MIPTRGSLVMQTMVVLDTFQRPLFLANHPVLVLIQQQSKGQGFPLSLQVLTKLLMCHSWVLSRQIPLYDFERSSGILYKAVVRARGCSDRRIIPVGSCRASLRQPAGF